MEKFLTIIIPVHNRKELVGRTLHSLEAQTARPLDIILVDNNSTDGTREELTRWQSALDAPDFTIRVLDCDTPGAAAARNKGLEAVTTPWVMFFDSDDTMRPPHCSRVIDTARSNPQLAIIGWDVDMHLADGSTRRGRFARTSHWTNIFHGGFATQRWCARTELVRKVGAWNPAAMIWNDIELGTRLLNAGGEIACIEGEPSVDVYHTSDSISAQPWLQRLQRMDATAAIIENELPPEKRHWADYKRVIAAGEALRCAPKDPEVAAAARAMYSRALSRAGSFSRRMALRLAFPHIRRFPRGAAAILSLFK